MVASIDMQFCFGVVVIAVSTQTAFATIARAAPSAQEASLRGSPHLANGFAESASISEDDVTVRAAQLVATLEPKVRKVLAHIKADKGLSPEEAKERPALVEHLEKALSSPGAASTGVLSRAMALHEALAASHEFVARRADDLQKERTKLDADIQVEEAKILFAMLRQRRSLPMKAQLAILRRKQFANFAYAQQLLKAHHADTPLYSQFLALLPSSLEQQVVPQKEMHADKFAAAGSRGSIHVVSSQMTNAVKKMVNKLSETRDRLEIVAKNGSATEKQQASRIVVGLDSTLSQVHATADLTKQLDIMHEAEKNMTLWMTTAN